MSQAETYMREKNYERAYMLYFRYTILCTALLGHPGNKSFDMSQKRTMNQKCNAAIDLIEAKGTLAETIKHQHAQMKAIKLQENLDREQQAQAAAAAAMRQREQERQEALAAATQRRIGPVHPHPPAVPVVPFKESLQMRGR